MGFWMGFVVGTVAGMYAAQNYEVLYLMKFKSEIYKHQLISCRFVQVPNVRKSIDEIMNRLKELEKETREKKKDKE